jgi:hypothetical protein
MDLLMSVGSTHLRIKDYLKSIEQGHALLPPKVAIKQTLKALRLRHKKIKQSRLNGNKITFEFEDGTAKTTSELLVDLKGNIPTGFNRIMSVNEDFSFYTDDYKIRPLLTKVEKGMPIPVGMGNPRHMLVPTLKSHYLATLDGLLRRQQI